MSYALVYTFDSDRLIGLGRALSDGEYEAEIYDVALLPEYQRKGIGREMIALLCDQLPMVDIKLHAASEHEGFYEKCGFRKVRTVQIRSGKWLSRMNKCPNPRRVNTGDMSPADNPVRGRFAR